MAKPSFFDHRKFKRLVHLLKMPEPHVYGHVEYVWRVAYGSGSPVIGDETDVELAAQWQGEAGQFARAMVDVGLLDVQKKTGKLQVHDLYDHAPDYVASRFRMERYRQRKKRQQLRNGYGSNRPDQTRPDQTEKKEEEKEARAPKPHFVPPTVEEVEAYRKEAGLTFDAQRFVDHFTSNGWKVSGKSPMRDWKAAVRNWAKNERTFRNNGQARNPDQFIFDTIADAQRES